MKKAILTTIICSVIVVGFALTGFVVYDKFLSNNNEQNNGENNTQNNQENNNQTNEEENRTYFNSNRLSEANYTSKYYKKTEVSYGDVSKYTNIFECFADLTLENIKIEYATNELKNANDFGPEPEYYRDTYSLTSSEITSFLEEMKLSTQKLVGGFGPSINTSYLYVSYMINGKVHTTKLMVGMWMLLDTNDGNIYKIIDNNMPETKLDVLLVSDKYSDILYNIVNRLNGK